MIIAAKSENKITIEQQTVVKSAKVSTNKWQKLQKLLTRGLYEDPQTAVVAELTNNAVDAIVVSGKDPIENPVIVEFKQTETGEYQLSVKDNGIGMTHWEFENIFMNYLESTKEDDNETLGHFGLGGKSPLALKNPYTLISQKEGIKTTYLIWEGKEFTDYNVIYQCETTETGVEVIVPIKDYYTYRDFKEKALQKLAYYDTVCLIMDGQIIKNQIIRHEDWQYSTQNQSKNLHFCLKDVYYTIDFDKLGLKTIQCPIALRFDLNSGIVPTPSREGIIWDDETIKLFKDKITKTATWFLDKYNETNTEFTELDQIYNYFYYSNRYVKLGENDIKINNLFSFTDKKCNIPTFKGIEKLKLEAIYDNYNGFLKPYVSIGEINNGRYSGRNPKTNILSLVRNNKKLILCQSVPNKKMLEFIKDTIGDCVFINKRHNYELGKWYSEYNIWRNTDYSYAKFLRLYLYDKGLWRQVINEWNSLEKIYEDKFINVNSIQITKEWEESRKKQRVVVKGTKNQRLEGEINFKFAEKMEKYSQDWNCKFVSNVINLKDFHKRKELIVYGLEEQRQKLDDLFEIYKRSPKNKVQAAIVGQKDYEKLKKVKLHNLMTIEEFESSFNKPIARYVTAYKIEEFWSSNTTLFKNRSFIEEHINKEFGICIDRLKDYKDAYKNPSNELMKSLITFADKHKYYDYPMYELLENVKKEAPKLEFLKFFETNSRYSYSNTINKEALPIIQELLKARKFRMDWEHYVKPEETILEQEMETV